jgi:hypothetical protein
VRTTVSGGDGRSAGADAQSVRLTVVADPDEDLVVARHRRRDVLQAQDVGCPTPGRNEGAHR